MTAQAPGSPHSRPSDHHPKKICRDDAEILAWPADRSASALRRRRALAARRALARLDKPGQKGFVGRWTDDDSAILLACARRITRSAERHGLRGKARFAPSWSWTASLNW